MRILSSAILVGAFAACHGSSDMGGVYVGLDGSGTFFPCDSANVALMVPDSALAARYQTLGGVAGRASLCAAAGREAALRKHLRWPALVSGAAGC
jgi:hypothetical protein